MLQAPLCADQAPAGLLVLLGAATDSGKSVLAFSDATAALPWLCRWPSDLFALLQPMFPGQLPRLGRNLFNAIFLLDPSTLAGCRWGSLGSYRAAYTVGKGAIVRMSALDWRTELQATTAAVCPAARCLRLAWPCRGVFQALEIYNSMWPIRIGFLLQGGSPDLAGASEPGAPLPDMLLPFCPLTPLPGCWPRPMKRMVSSA